MEIYINQRLLQLCKSQEAAEKISVCHPHTLTVRYTGKKQHLLPYIDYLEKDTNHHSIAIYAADVSGLQKDLFSLFKIVEAAGGIVTNPNNEILFMYRRGYWDLPKGKIDAGETREQAAVREVQEETGLSAVKLLSPICTTYHTYRTEKKRILKPTYWYSMKAAERSPVLKPQSEEGIEELRWMTAADFLQSELRTYTNISQVIASM